MKILIAICLSFGLLTTTLPTYAASEPQDVMGVLKHVYLTNPGLNATRERLKETKELYPQAVSGWRPSIEAEASLFATDIDNSNFGGGDGATTKDLTLTFDQPLWRGGKTFSDVREAKDLINAGEALLHEAEQNVFLDTIGAILSVSRDTELYNLRLKNEQSLSQDFKATKARFENGVLTRTDVEQATARLQRTQANTINAARALDISRAEFAEVTGLNPDNIQTLPAMDFQFPAAIEDMLDTAEQQNPSLWIARYEENAAGHNAVSAFRDLLPRISAFASYNKQYDPQPGIIPDSQAQTIGVRAVIPLYQAGLKRSQMRAAKYSAQRLIYESEVTARRIRQDVIRNYRSYLSAQEELRVRQDEITSSENALIGVREEERLGQRTILDVLDADRELITAKVSLATARYNQAFANVALAANLGLLNASNLGLLEGE